MSKKVIIPAEKLKHWRVSSINSSSDFPLTNSSTVGSLLISSSNERKLALNAGAVNSGVYLFTLMYT